MYSYSISKKLVLTALLAASVSVSATEATSNDAKSSQVVKDDAVKIDEAAKATAALIAATLGNASVSAADLPEVAPANPSLVEDESQEASISADSSAEADKAIESTVSAAEVDKAEASTEVANKQEEVIRPEASEVAVQATTQATDEPEFVASTQELVETKAPQNEAKSSLPVAAMPAPKPLPAAALATSENSAPSYSAQMNTQSCPQSFYEVSLPKDGKLCQVFAADLPASMILFVPQTPAQVIEFYQQDSANFGTSKQVKDRFMLQSIDKNKTVIISADGQGTQIDILVKGVDS